MNTLYIFTCIALTNLMYRSLGEGWIVVGWENTMFLERPVSNVTVAKKYEVVIFPSSRGKFNQCNGIKSVRE